MWAIPPFTPRPLPDGPLPPPKWLARTAVEAGESLPQHTARETELTRHPLLQAALARIAECPDGRGAGFSSDCVALDCGWSHGITADREGVHRALEDHALDTGHVIFHTVVATLNAVDVVGVRERRRTTERSAGRSPA